MYERDFRDVAPAVIVHRCLKIMQKIIAMSSERCRPGVVGNISKYNGVFKSSQLRGWVVGPRFLFSTYAHLGSFGGFEVSRFMLPDIIHSDT